MPWTSKVTNKTVLEHVKTKISSVGKITKQGLSYFGHIMRANSLETTIVLSIVSGTRRGGSQRTLWLDTIKADINMPMKELKEAVKD